MGNSYNSLGIVRVTPTLSDGVAYGAGEVLFTTTEIPNAVRGNGGCSRLIGITILNRDDVANDMNLVFMQVDKDLGTINEAVGSGSLWTNALATAAKVIGHIRVDWSDSSVDLVNNLVWTSFKSGSSGGDADGGIHLPMLLQAEGGSTSVYFAGVSIGTPTTATDDYEFIFHIEYK